MKNKKVLFIGDSIVARGSWSAISSFEILNLGRDGNRVRDLKKEIDLYDEYNIKEVFLYVGVNDLLSLKSVDEVFFEYKEFVLDLIKNSSTLTLFFLIYTQIRATNKKIKLFNEKLSTFAKEHKIKVLDLNPFFSHDFCLRDQYSVDGVHINTKAYKIWQELLNKTT